MKKLSIVSLLVLIFSVSNLFAAPEIRISVGEARVQKSRMAFPALRYQAGSSDPNGYSRIVRDVITEDLIFSGLFDFIDPSAFLEQKKSSGVKFGTFKFSDWTTIGAQFLIKGDSKVVGKRVSMNIYIYSTHSGKQLLAKKYQSKAGSLRKLAHTISNDVMLALTGRKGPFTSKIAFVSDRTGKKEIYLMDYDGHNRIQVTNRESVAMSPSWDPSGNKLIFSSVMKNKKNVRNHNLYTYNLRTGTIRSLSNRKGLNSGARYSPNGREITLTMSFLGNPEIFVMNPKSKVAKRITHSYGLDVDPSWSPDGKQIVFVSDRSGRPMVYRMNKNGKNVKRITYAGKYNAAPSWSPAGDKIVFAGWDKNHFDIFLINPDGSSLERLTKGMGNNEDPHFAPDGYFIVYSSNRSGKRELYITNVDNTIHRRITKNFGNSDSPKWGPSR